MKKKWLAMSVLGSVLMLAACGSDDSTTDTAVDPNEKVAQQRCVNCHGGDLQGAGAPALNTIGSKYTEEEILDIIVNGKDRMPGGLIKGEEAEALAAWLAEKK